MNNKIFNFSVRRFLIFIMLTILMSVIGIGVVGAYTGTFRGRAQYFGYFENTRDSWGGKVLPDYGAPGSDSIPTSIDTIDKFITFLKTNNASGNAQKVTGSAFIVNLMLYGDAPAVVPKTTIITSAEFIDLEDRLNRYNSDFAINWNESISNSENLINSYYQGIDIAGHPGQSNPADDAFYTLAKGGSGIAIRDAGGAIVFKILHECANPIGDLDIIDPVPTEWSTTLSSSIDKTTAQVGETVSWTYSASVSGSTATDRQINYGYFNTRAGGSSNSLFDSKSTAVGNFPNNTTPPANSGAYSFTYTITAADSVGDVLCSSAYASPRSVSDLTTAYSTNECVTVVDNVIANDVCRPIEVRVRPKDYGTVSGISGGSSDSVNTNLTTYPGATLITRKYYDVENYSIPDVTVGTVPVKVYIDSDTSSNTVASNVSSNADITLSDTMMEKFTDGDEHIIYFEELHNHLTGYDVSYDLKSTTTTGNITTVLAIPPLTTNTYSGTKTITKRYELDIDSVFTGAVTWSDSFQCYDYNLNSSGVNVSAGSVESGSIINLNPSISNSSFTNGSIPGLSGTILNSKSKSSNWQISQIIFPPSSTVNSVSSSINSDNPCSFYQSSLPTGTCTVAQSISSVSASPSVASLTGSSVFSNSGSRISGADPFNKYTVIDDLEPGSTVCYAFSVYAATSEPKNGAYSTNSTSINSSDVNTAGGEWRHSALNVNNNCIKVVKKPKVQVLGGDLLTGRAVNGYSTVSSSNIATTTTLKKLNGIADIRMFGSWVEYAIFSKGTVTGIASASAFSSPQGLSVSSNISSSTITSSLLCDSNELTFTNTPTNSTACNGTNIGNYSNSGTIPDVASAFTVDSSTQQFTGGSLDSLSGLYRTNGNVSITSSEISAGQWVVINAEGHNVTINSDINYTTNSLTSINDIPQVVIIANSISISGSVSKVDSWLIAKGSSGFINTCSQTSPSHTTRITSSTCSTSLIVNGPVMATHLYLRRTAGAGDQASSGTPAETFNLRADAYIWANSHVSDYIPIQTTYTTELPPRL